MNIGIDIDGVLTDIEQWQLDYGSKVVFEKYQKGIINPEGYDVTEIFDVDKNLDDEFWRKYLYDYAKNEPARKFANEVTKKLSNDGNKVYIITARFLTDRDTDEGQKMREIVRNWLKENEICYNDIIFSPEDKLEICLNNNIDVMIDDKVENINEISKHIPVICFNAGYNKECKGENIYRAYSWYDVYNKIKEIENKNKIVIFDWGGVIESHKEGEYSIDRAIINLIKHFNSKEDEKTIVERYHAQSVEDITYHIYLENDKWFEKIKKEFNLKCNSEEFYDYYIKEFDKIDYYKDVVEFAHSLKDKCKIAILSNLGSLDKQRLDKQVDLKQFDYVWLSFELNCRKPKEKIYEIVEKDCNIEPKNILFIDDSKENIEVANKREWNTCLAIGHELDKIKEKVNEFLNR